MKNAIEFVAMGGDVKRYHTVSTLMNETVGHHSHGVACLALILNPKVSRKVLIAAMLHDLAEQFTGDIPSPAKREYGINAQVEKLERKFLNAAGFVFPLLRPAEERLLKLVDIAHGALFCAREISLGNVRLQVVFDKYMSYADKMKLTPREKKMFTAIKEIADER